MRGDVAKYEEVQGDVERVRVRDRVRVRVSESFLAPSR